MSSDELEQPAWTYETLRIFLQRQIDDMRHTLAERQREEQRATEVAFNANEAHAKARSSGLQDSLRHEVQAVLEVIKKVESVATHRFKVFREEHGDRHNREAEDVLRLAAQLREAVALAMEAVNERATLHASNHEREHVAHERIHQVEKEARQKADETLETRLAYINEIREQLGTQKSEFVTRDAHQGSLTDLNRRLETITASLGGMLPRETFDAVMSSHVAAKEGALQAMAARVDVLEKSRAQESGRARGIQSSWGVIAAGVTTVAAVVVVVNIIIAIAGG